MKTLTNGKRKAILSPLGEGQWTVWVGYHNPNGDDTPALWFKGFRTCGNTYKSLKAAEKAAEKFLTH